ncbi:hypothetical protein [Caldinitratiruptor microaerophilus]|uniref:Regulatory protein YycH-like domain-containing protein n=1 Tax=Caldinitratiruptor microaerophilus TaxID=671077 RepID=A0AA35G9T6_9FIRM|nr:hypothetical protein [Caldinitratiruptor microaerophilus]BDG61818.1 hypothetical protein caldi_29080 [Caldinitratiruptor microaerophilus]
MDWPRARAILLVTFTLVNLLLGVRLWASGRRQPGADPGLASLQLSEVRARLAEQGFRLTARLEAHPPVRPLLRLSPPDPRSVEAVAARLASPGPGTARAEAGGVVVYRPALPWGRAPRPGDRGAREAAEAFLRATGLASFVDLAPSRVRTPEPGLAEVEFVPLRSGFPVYSGWVRVSVGPAGVVEARAFLPGLDDLRGDPKGVIAPTEALLRLAGQLAAGSAGRGADGTVTFTDVRLGYYAPRPPGARAWDAVAVWRVLTDGGDAYYVNAFTGELMTAQEAAS